MCGIAGVFGIGGPEAAAVVDNMLLVQAHRGPDDQHLRVGRNYILGARRLSIIDLEGGQQPLGLPERGIWAAQNGEIYNFQEIRQELEGKGHRYKTRCDTESIPQLYSEYGRDFVKRLDGMFAISVWDENEQLGILARDRAGKKPLYYTSLDHKLYYSSEIKGLLQIPGFVRKINQEALHHYLSYKNVPCPLSIFEGIFQLPPAHRLVWCKGKIESIQPYWQLDWSPSNLEASEDELAQVLVQKLTKALQRRLIADVPIGFFLSGGLDSSLSTALAASSSGQRVKTFTLRYSKESSTPGKELDLRCAREIAKKYDTDHHEEELDFSRFQEELPHILSHFDEPFSGVVSTYFLSRLIRKHLKVAISGDGADELYGSYLSHRLAIPVAARRAWLANGRSGPAPALGHFESQPDFVDRLAALDEVSARYSLLVFNDQEKSALYNPSLCDLSERFSTLTHMGKKYATLTAQDPLNRVLEYEFNTQLPDQVLAFADRLSMAHALEIRTAFLDTDVMEFSAKIPPKYKIWAEGQEIKALLKRAARGFLPDSAIDRPKEGFIMPVNQWLGQDLFPYAQNTLRPAQLKKHDLFRSDVVESLLANFKAGQSNLANKILSLLCFQVWFDNYIDSQPTLPLGEAAKYRHHLDQSSDNTEQTDLCVG